MEVETLLYLKGNDPIGDIPIFDINDYGRKGNIRYLAWQFFEILPYTKKNAPLNLRGC